MTNEKTLSATQKIFKEFWQKQGPGQPIEGIVRSLAALTEVFDKKATPRTMKLYIAALADCTEEEIILGFSRALERCKYFPSPATLREFSGRAVTADPVEAAAKKELLKLIEAMRSEHGPTLKPVLCDVYVEDGNGDGIIRSESRSYYINRRTEAALVRLGWGDRTRGIAVIADHPALGRRQESDDQLRAADEILKRFTDAYRDVEELWGCGGVFVREEPGLIK